jgi:hypothetical protein
MSRSDHVGHEVPLVIEQSIAYLKEHHVEQIEGIFRLNGNHTIMQQLKRDYDKGDPVDLSSVKDIHVVAGLLELYVESPRLSTNVRRSSTFFFHLIDLVARTSGAIDSVRNA